MVLDKMQETTEITLVRVVMNDVVTVPPHFSKSQLWETKASVAIDRLNIVCNGVIPLHKLIRMY